jgi:hypothetical protein
MAKAKDLEPIKRELEGDCENWAGVSAPSGLVAPATEEKFEGHHGINSGAKS